jgi:hypothetical protein
VCSALSEVAGGISFSDILFSGKACLPFNNKEHRYTFFFIYLFTRLSLLQHLFRCNREEGEGYLSIKKKKIRSGAALISRTAYFD